MKKIIVSVTPAGDVTVTTRGYTGKGCKEASRSLEEALGTATAETLTADYHRAEPTSNQAKANQ